MLNKRRLLRLGEKKKKNEGFSVATICSKLDVNRFEFF